MCVRAPDGVANPSVPPYPTLANCELMAAYAEGLSGGALDFTCEPIYDLQINGSFVGTCVRAIAYGSLEVNAVCSAAAANSFSGLYEAAGYANYTCNLEGATSTTCGCSDVGTSPQCQNFSPPPSPPPPSPPPPPPPVDFPHSCLPGNSVYNEGVGEVATETAGFAWNIMVNNITNRSYTVNMMPNPSCEPSLSGRTDCCNTQFKKT
eukprot:267241-Chlamydomonas_euryale.AAC.1